MGTPSSHRKRSSSVEFASVRSPSESPAGPTRSAASSGAVSRTSERTSGSGAFDIEYYGSPWIPPRGVDAPTPFYHADAPSGLGASVAQSVIYDPCLDVWNRACNFAFGHDTTATCQCYPIGDTTDTGLTTTTVNALWELDAAVRLYFAQTGNAQVEADRKTVGPGMVIGSSTYDPSTKTFSGNYVTRLLQWSVFGFGSDLMHFDICHNPGKSIPPISEVTSCAQVVDAFGTTSDGANPWCPTAP
jgi:hypothetical protein